MLMGSGAKIFAMLKIKKAKVNQSIPAVLYAQALKSDQICGKIDKSLVLNLSFKHANGKLR